MSTTTETAIETDLKLPIIRITRDEVRPDRIVQTFTYEGEPDGVALETLWFEDRDAWLAGGMETGVSDGYAKLQRMVDNGAV
jgi:hypothetical protein